MSPRGEDLRELMRTVPSGVAVLTVDAEGGRVGLTVASLISLSLDPPLVGVAVNRNAAMHELLRGSGRFAFSLLAEDQTALAQHFARGVPPIAMWHGIAWRAGTTGAPLLDGAVGWLECHLAAEHGTGDHTLFVGEVVALDERPTARPLLYVDHGYVAP